MKHFIFIFQSFIAIVLLEMAATGGIPEKSSTSTFASELFNEVSKVNPNKNILISPISIQTCIAMAYFGAAGKTASEMSTGLHLTNDKNQVASNFEKLTNSGGGLVKIANKLYASKAYEIKPEFNEVATKSFQSKAETLDFSKSAESIKTINDWVESNTNNKIINLLPAGSVDDATKMILVNAIHFKGEWENQFLNYSTTQSDFWVSENQNESVSMMSNTDPYKYGYFSELDATAIEMPYKNSDLSMMIILPKERNGLNDLLLKLKNIDFIELANKMIIHDVEVAIPKFKIEYEINLNNVLKSMGMTTMYSNDADFSNLFKQKILVKVSDVIHKAFLDVNEAGSEAAAATFMKIVPMSLILDEIKFRADHPFICLIKDKNYVYFLGQVLKI